MDITEINELIRTLDTFINIAKYIGIGAIIVIILVIFDIFAIAGDTRKLTKQVELQNKQMELLNKQIDYLLQLEERKQGINQNPSQNVRQNTPQNLMVADLTQDNKRNNQRKSEITLWSCPSV